MKIFHTLLTIAFCLSAFFSHAQNDTTLAPYLKDKNLPALVVLKMDSTEFNTYNIPEGKKSVLFYFSPDCEHCQMLTEEILKDLDALKKAEIYMISPMDLKVVREFDEKYQISEQKNMHIYKDAQHLFPSYYGLHYFPFLVIYDKNKKLIKAFEGTIKMEDLNDLIQQ